MNTNLNIKEISKRLSNYNYYENINATAELVKLFNRITRTPLKTNDDYIKMYDDSFYTYQTWEDLVKSEQEQSDGLSEEECRQELNKSIWELPCGWFVQYV